jgi:hypothetical protein
VRSSRSREEAWAELEWGQTWARASMLRRGRMGRSSRVVMGRRSWDEAGGLRKGGGAYSAPRVEGSPSPDSDERRVLCRCIRTRPRWRASSTLAQWPSRSRRRCRSSRLQDDCDEAAGLRRWLHPLERHSLCAVISDGRRPKGASREAPKCLRGGSAAGQFAVPVLNSIFSTRRIPRQLGSSRGRSRASAPPPWLSSSANASAPRSGKCVGRAARSN